MAGAVISSEELFGGNQNIISSEELFGKKKKIEAPETNLAGRLIELPRGLGETAAALTTGLAGFIGGKAAGLGTLALTLGDAGAAKAVEEGVADYLTFKPTTETGKHFTEKLGKIVSAPAEVGKEAVALPMESWKVKKESPIGYLAETAGEIAPYGMIKPTGKLVREALRREKARPVEEPLKAEAKPEILTTEELKAVEVKPEIVTTEELGVEKIAPKIKSESLVDIAAASPVRDAISYIKENGGFNLDKLSADYPKETIKALNQKGFGLVTKKGNLTHDVIAEDFGFESGDALINSILDLKSKKQISKEVKAQFDQFYKGEIKIAKKGFEPTKEGIWPEELDVGDKIYMKDDTYKVVGFDNKARVILKDGDTITQPLDKKIDAQGIKKKVVETQTEIPGASERETFNLAPAEGEFGGDVMPTVKPHETADFAKLIQEQRTAEQRGEISFRKKAEAPEPIVKFEGELETRFKAAQGQAKASPYEWAMEKLTKIKNDLSRPYEHLPRTGEYAEAQFALKKLEKQREVAAEKVVRAKADELAGLNSADYDLFTRKVILDDLAYEVEKGHALPFGFTKESLAIERGKVEKAVSANPRAQASLEKRKASWDTLKAVYTQAMKEIGFDVSEKFQNDAYFRHQVLEYANAKGIYGTGQKLKTPASRGFLKKRGGSELDINTDYLEAEYEVYGQMLRDIETARTIKRIDVNYNIADRIRKEAKAKGIDDWHKAIPEGYTTWQPREGNVFYFSDSVPAQLAEKLYSGALEELGLTAADLKKVMTVGGKRREFVIKQELAATLDNLAKGKAESLFERGDKAVLKSWKVWQLISPRRFLKYNIRNLTGDADASFVGNPGGFSRVPQAVKELYDVYVNKKPMSPEMQDYFDRGGLQATLQAQEIGDLKKLWVFKKLYPEGRGITDLPRMGWEKYWKAARMSTDFREGILRFSNYLDYLDQMKKSPEGKPKSFGASIPEEIMGLKDIKDRAFWLSNDLLGAYDRVSVAGQWTREHLFPFWSWKEVNFVRYKRFLENAIQEGTAPREVAKKALGSVAIKSPYVAYKVGSFLIKATAFMSMVSAWNHLIFPEEERDLSDETKKSTHIIFGRDAEGKIIYFNRMGALGDILEWFGLDATPKYVDKWLRDKQSLKDVALEMAKDAATSPVNVVVSGSIPFAKLGYEIATRRSTFPDVFRPGTVRDRGLHLARSFGLENEYIALSGLPSKGYGQSLSKMVAYSADPLEGSYRDIFELKNNFLKKEGKSAEGFWLTPKGDALYNMKLALRFGDKKAFEKYATDYMMMGGKGQGITASLKRMDPLSGMNTLERNTFLSTLDKKDMDKLTKAYQFYYGVLMGGNQR